MRRKALALSLAVAAVLLLMTHDAPAEAGPPFDFSIVVDTPKETMAEGMVSSTTSNALYITLKSGAPEIVTMSFESTPPGPDVQFLPFDSCSLSCVLGIHLGFLGGAQLGTYSITITGTGGGVSHDTKLTLNVPQAVGGIAELGCPDGAPCRNSVSAAGQAAAGAPPERRLPETSFLLLLGAGAFALGSMAWYVRRGAGGRHRRGRHSTR